MKKFIWSVVKWIWDRSNWFNFIAFHFYFCFRLMVIVIYDVPSTVITILIHIKRIPKQLPNSSTTQKALDPSSLQVALITESITLPNSSTTSRGSSPSYLHVVDQAGWYYWLINGRIGVTRCNNVYTDTGVKHSYGCVVSCYKLNSTLST